MNTKLHLEVSEVVRLRSTMGLQVVHDRATTTAVLLGELVLRGRSQIPLGISMLNAELLITFQNFIVAVTANDNPIIPGVAFHLLAEARNLLLPTQRTAHQVRVQVLLGIRVREADFLTALDRSARSALRQAVTLPQQPKRGRLALLRDQSNDLLSRSGAEILVRAVEIVLSTAFDVSEFNGRATSNSLPVFRSVRAAS